MAKKQFAKNFVANQEAHTLCVIPFLRLSFVLLVTNKNAVGTRIVRQ